MESTNPFAVANMFLDYARKIHKKASPADPNYLGICVMTGKIEAWVEHHYPSFISISKESKTVTLRSADPRSKIVLRDRDLEKERVMQLRGEEAVKKEFKAPHQTSTVPWELYLFTIGALLFLFVVTGLSFLALLYYFYGNDWNWEELGMDQTNSFLSDIGDQFVNIWNLGRKPAA